MSSGEWFYLESDRELGPVTQEQLLLLLRSKLPRGTLVWRDGLAEWMKAEDVPEIAALLAAPRPSVPSLPPRTPRAPERRPATPLAVSGEPETWNPFVLLLRCFQWGGRFSRAECAIAYFSNLLLGFGLIFGLFMVAFVAASGKSQAAGTAAGLLMIAWGLVAIVISLGAGVRRLHDLDKPGWWILGILVPCLNFVMLLYFLFAPGLTEGPGSAMPVLVIAAALLILAVPVIGIVAAIAIPSLLRARVSANEAATIGDIRTIISGQAVYQSINGGFYASRLECLTRPGDCIANSTSPQILDPATIASPKSGYVREFVPGPLARGSATSTTGYAFLAYPVNVGQTGVRSFCGDASGRICYDPRGGKDLVETVGAEVQCSMRCQTVQ
jgi:type IV pilus assembly protein PilA